ncbi:hypothetical protein AnigIFM59636_005723 [Aspergillus niger]|nr:hypothetical protein AnigIFM59636_005723 [Aspergillus niger]
MEECLKMIQGSRNFPGDDLLVQMIKLQRITSKVTDVRIQLRDADCEQSTRLISPYISALNSQLAETRKSFPPQVAADIILTLIRLASLEDPAWDVNMVRRTVDITSILDRTAENLSNVQPTSDEGDDHENVVAKSLAWVKRMRSCLLAVYGQSTDAQTPTSEVNGSMGIPGVKTLLSGQAAWDVSLLNGGSGMDIFSSFEEDIFGEDISGWWPQLYSENGL